MARPRTHDQALRIRLLDEAGRLLAEEGPSALTVRRLAERAGTSPSAVYGLFGDKWGLVDEMFREGFARFAERIAERPASADPLADLAAVGQAFRLNARANPHLYDLMFGHPFPEFQPSESVQALALGTFLVLVGGVQRCIDTGVLHGDATGLAGILFGMAHGLTSLELMGWLGPPDQADGLWERAGQAMLRGLAGAPERG